MTLNESEAYQMLLWAKKQRKERLKKSVLYFEKNIKEYEFIDKAIAGIKEKAKKELCFDL